MRPMNPFRRYGVALAGAVSVAAAVAPTQVQASSSAPAVTRVAKPAHAHKKRQAWFEIASVTRNLTVSNSTRVTGVLRPQRGGRRVRLQVRRGTRWQTVARDSTSRRGRFQLRYRPRRAAAMHLRVVFGGDRRGRAARGRIGTVNVFRRALASWYGPGLYGGHLACGGRLRPSTLGVAHKSLPCGTRVTLRLRGRSVRVRVVDRGPFVGAREYDLTSATRARLGFSGVGTVLTTR